VLENIFKYTFLQNALFAAILGSIVCGIVGTIIVEKKLVSMSGGIAHTSFGGIGLSYLIGIEPIFGGLAFAIMASLSIPIINKKTNTKSDTLIGIFWSVGMALGIFFISMAPSYPPDMTSYLFGDILTVSTMYVKVIFVLTLIILFIILSFFNYWKSFLFDKEFSSIIGIKSDFFEYLLMILIGLSIVVMIKVVGIILSIALLTIPPATARLFTYNLKNIMIFSILLGLLFCYSGLNLSYTFNVPSGATIIVVSVIGYFLSLIIRKSFIKN
jgi:zinc transport system permease protein